MTPRRRVGAAAVAAALALMTAACTGSGHTTATRVTPAAHASTGAAAPAAKMRITPANGAANVDPSAGITVTAAEGTLKNVTVRTAGDPVSGRLSQGARAWHSQWALDVSQRYMVTATVAAPGGGTVTATSTFRTLTPSRTFATHIVEGYQQAYGVGMPIILY